jgi:hypothetical protein
LGKGSRTLPVDRCKLRGGDDVWQRTFHVLLYTSFFWKMLWALQVDMG